MIPSPARSGIRLRGRIAAWLSAVVMACAIWFACPTAAAAEGDVTLDVTDVTAVVTADSGYRLALSIVNNTDQTLQPGTVTLFTDTRYTFVSRNDIQQWAQGEVGIPTPQELAHTQTPAVAPGDAAAVPIDVAADSETLSSITDWGPKPVYVRLQAGHTTADLRTFLTRSSDGLSGTRTPAMDVTVVMPLTSDDWQVDEDALDRLLHDGSGTDDIPLELTDEGGTDAKQWVQLSNLHPQLQLISDPTYLEAMAMPARSAAIMQPAAFDITAYAVQDPERIAAAGIEDDLWSADAGLAHYRRALGDDQATGTAIAWQGAGEWTMSALEAAKRQGYDTVVATSGFTETFSGTVHTDTHVVTTAAGDVTVLSAQPILSALASGEATNDAATAERTSAGRLARFVAQSAFYQMEQPYATRNLLVVIDPTADAAAADALLSAIEQSPWLNMTDLDTLLQADPYATGQEASWAVPERDGLSQEQQDGITQTLDAAAQTEALITRFQEAVLDDASSTATSAEEDTQALARQDADDVMKRPADSSDWADALRDTSRRLTLHALSGNAAVRDRMTAGVRTIADGLNTAVSITPMETLNVVSETANMPVTVSNTLPYPVRVRVSATTDSMTIVTSRFADLTVPPTGEEQTTLAVRVSTSGSTTAHLTLLDRDGTVFGASQSTTITSALQLSDMSGFLIIVFAVLLGIVGLWRQFHRVKDPDE